VRVVAERVLRATALGALAVALWQRLAPATVSADAAVQRAGGAGLPAALARWTVAPTAAAHVRFDTLPGPAARAWLGALSAAGTRVTWRAERAPALAAVTEAVADPAGGTRLLAAAPHGATVAAADALGPLDSVVAGETRGAGPVLPAPGDTGLGDTGPGDAGNVSDQAGIILPLPEVAGAVRVRAGGVTARVPAPAAPPRFGAVLVVAHAGWEGRFAAAALEERGWTVRTRFAVAPGVVVGDAGRHGVERAALPPRLDTAVLAAVIVLDSTGAVLAPALARYVRAGGGLVLAGEAARAPALAALAPAAPGPTIDDSAGAIVPLARPRADAVPLAARRVDGARTLVAAARRVGAGRVVQMADAESWRQRMRPDDGAAAEHRAWWAQAVAAAAYAPVAPAAPAPPSAADLPADPAPLAATVAALGPAGDPPAAGAPATRPASSSRVPDAVLVPLALAALLAEVASRRLRGAS